MSAAVSRRGRGRLSGSSLPAATPSSSSEPDYSQMKKVMIGGAAKALIASGRVQVDGRDELRKTCKIRAGQVVTLGDVRIRVLGAS